MANPLWRLVGQGQVNILTSATEVKGKAEGKGFHRHDRARNFLFMYLAAHSTRPNNSGAGVKYILYCTANSERKNPMQRSISSVMATKTIRFWGVTWWLNVSWFDHYAGSMWTNAAVSYMMVDKGRTRKCV